MISLDNGFVACSSVPSGASVGKHEAVELRDGDVKRYNGKGVLKAINNIENKIAPELIGKEPDFRLCDKIMLDLDGTSNKANLGANAILAVSIAVARAQALCEGKEVFELFGAKSCPEVMFNILNGGAHATNNIDFQEFMIMPLKGENFAQKLHTSVLIYHKLRELLEKEGYSTGVGDEGGFAPRLKTTDQSAEREALDFLLRSCELAGFEPGNDVVFCLDVAASQFFHEKNLTSLGLIDEYKELCREYPIYSIEDGLPEDDWVGFVQMTQELGSKIKIVGDDIFASNPERIKKGIEQGAANSVLIKPNQIGTVSETLEAIKICQDNNYDVVISHRSGETCDTFISDLVVGVGAQYFKAGAPARGERVAKYNRLLEIVE
jgi:enolase